MIDLYEQYKNRKKLSVRKKIHSMYSVNKIDIFEVFRRICDANSILDIGCGGGDLLVKIRTSGFKGRLKGIDKYEIYKETAEFCKNHNLNIEFEQIDIARQTDPKKWDAGVMINVLCYIPEFRNVIERYSAICKKIIVVDAGPEAYPNFKRYYKKLEEVFKIKLKTLGINFTVQDAIVELMKYYGTVDIQRLNDAFRFTEVGPIIEYFSTNRGGWDPESSDNKWNEILEYVKSTAQKEIDVQGEWFEPKPYYIITAENPVKNESAAAQVGYERRK